MSRPDPATARSVRIRGAGRCEYCHLPESVAELPFQLDHIVALKHLGLSDESNLGEEWDWQIMGDQKPHLAKFVFVTLPDPPSEGKTYLRAWKQCYQLSLFGCGEDTLCQMAGAL